MRNPTLVVLSLLLTACVSVRSTPPVEQTFERSRTYNASFDQVWLRAVDWFADHNVMIEKIERESGLITAKYLLVADQDYLDCGTVKMSGTSGKTIDRYGSLNVTVRQRGPGVTQVNVNFFGEFTASAYDPWNGRVITTSGRCVSKGTVEQLVLAYIEN